MICLRDNMSKKEKTYSYKEFKILDRLSVGEHIVSMVVKFFGYTFSYLESFQHLRLFELKPSEKTFRIESSSYEENGHRIYRRKGCETQLLSTFRGLETIPEVIKKVLREKSNRNLMGYRKILSERSELEHNLKQKYYYNLGPFEWLTQTQVYDRIMCLTSYLSQIGVTKGDRVVIFADTCVDWLVVAFAIMILRACFVTVYPTLPDDYISSCIKMTEPKAIFIDKKSANRVHPIMDQFPYIKHVIYATMYDSKGFPDFSNYEITCVSLESIFENQKVDENYQDTLDQSKPEDLAVIMFTSGSTGIPKGVAINQSSLIAGLEGSMFGNFLKDQIYPGYLPLSHIFELMCEMYTLFSGGMIGYCNPGTLFEGSPFLEMGCKSDFSLLHPTRLVTVPLILERIMKNFMIKIKSAPRVKVVMFQTLYNIKSHFLSKGRSTKIIDKFFSKKFSVLFGGQLSFILVGGAYLLRETEEFFNVVFCPLKQGFGATEITSAGMIPSLDYLRLQNIGAPFGCAEAKIIPWEEGGYPDNGLETKRGELLISGPCVTNGYFKNEALTKEIFKLDPATNKIWYHTSDIVELNQDGTFKIIGRKSDVIKLMHGEYVQLTNIETTISQSKYVDFVCVTQNKTNEYLIAVICVNIQNLMSLAESLEYPQDLRVFKKLVNDNKIIEKIQEDINSIIKAGIKFFDI